MFPRWMNQLPPVLFGGALSTLVVVIAFVWYYFTPKFWVVGYMPTQPGGGFSHEIHVGMLGMDCRYCHTHVETSYHANVPDVSTCMNCHADGRLNADITARIDPKIQFVRDAYAADASIEWRRVHKVPDYARFPHHVHVNAGISCYSCHGQIGRMEVVHQAEPMSMGWCLDCHRGGVVDNLVDAHGVLGEPQPVTHLFDVEELLLDKAQQAERGRRLLGNLQEKGLHLLPENCGACHY